MSDPNPFTQPPLPLLTKPTNAITRRIFVAATRMNDGKTTACLGLFAAQIVAMQLHADPAVLLPPPSSVPVIHKIAENATPHVIPIAALALLYTTALFAALPFIHLPALIDHYRHR